MSGVINNVRHYADYNVKVNRMLHMLTLLDREGCMDVLCPVVSTVKKDDNSRREDSN